MHVHKQYVMYDSHLPSNYIAVSQLQYLFCDLSGGGGHHTTLYNTHDASDNNIQQV